MKLDNYLIVNKQDGEVFDYRIAETNSVGTGLPKSWLACFVKGDAIIREDEGLVLETTVFNALERLSLAIGHFVQKPPVKSNFSTSMLDEILETYRFLEKVDPNYSIEVFFGCYGDLVSLERFKETSGAGIISMYGDDNFVLYNLNEKEIPSMA